MNFQRKLYCLEAIFFCPQPFRCEDFLWILTLFSFHWPFVAMFFKLFTQYRPRDHGANKVGRNQMYDFFLGIVIPREVKKKKKEKLKKYTSLVFYHQFILLTTKVKTSNIKLLLYIQTYLLSVYLQVLFNCVRKISLIVSRRKVGMVIHFSVGEDPVLSGLKKHTCFYPCLANWIKYHLKFVYVEVVKRRKCYIYNGRFLYCLFWRFCFPFL